MAAIFGLSDMEEMIHGRFNVEGFVKPGFWVSWRHLGSLKKARFDTAEERAVFLQTWLRDGKPDLWETNSQGQRIYQKIEKTVQRPFPELAELWRRNGES